MPSIVTFSICRIVANITFIAHFYIVSRIFIFARNRHIFARVAQIQKVTICPNIKNAKYDF